jgi:hypothetical protein
LSSLLRGHHSQIICHELLILISRHSRHIIVEYACTSFIAAVTIISYYFCTYTGYTHQSFTTHSMLLFTHLIVCLAMNITILPRTWHVSCCCHVEHLYYTT